MATKQETIKWLSQYRNINNRIKSLKEQIASIRERATAVTQNYASDGGRGKGKVSDKVGEAAIQIQSVQEQIDKELQKSIAIEFEIRTAIEKVDNILYKTLLEERYIMCKSWWEIAINLNYTADHCRSYLLDRALSEIVFANEIVRNFTVSDK